MNFVENQEVLWLGHGVQNPFHARPMTSIFSTGQMPDGSGFYSRQMSHCVELNRGQIPGGCPEGGWSRLELTDIFRCQNNKKYIPILRNVLVTHECPDLRMSFNYLTGQNRDNKRALRGKKLPSLLANSASIDRGLRSHSAVTYRNRTASNWGCERHSTISSQFPRILYNREQKSVYLAHGESSRWVF